MKQKALVLKHFVDSSQHLGDFAKRAFDEEWIDVEPKPGKVGGAFCSNQPQIGQSRIYTNFLDHFLIFLHLHMN